MIISNNNEKSKKYKRSENKSHNEWKNYVEIIILGLFMK